MIDVNLLPPEVLARQQPRWGRTLLLAGLASAAIWAGYAVFQVRLDQLGARAVVRQLQAQAGRLSGYAAEAGGLARQLRALRAQDAFVASVHRARWAQGLEDLLHLGQATGVAVGALSWGGGGPATLQGSAVSLQALARFASGVRGSGYWTACSVQGASLSAGGTYTFTAQVQPGPWADPQAASATTAGPSTG